MESGFSKEASTPYNGRSLVRTFLTFGLIATVAVVSLGILCIALSNDPKQFDNSQCNLSPELIAEIRSYQPIVNRIVAAAVNGPFSGQVYEALDELVDRFGPRMEGTPALDKAIDFVVGQMKAAGLDNVHTHNVTVPHWERGFEDAELVSPYKHKLNINGLGGTIGTPTGGIEADVLITQTFEDFDKIPEEKVRGKIVIFVPKWHGYSQTLHYRNDAAPTAAKKGAVATFVVSMTPFSIGSPHTGWQDYKEGIPQIPTASITLEDASTLLSMYNRNISLRIHLEMNGHNFEPAPSRNTIGELTGRQPRPVVVLSGHLDSWDLGWAAMDDGGGSYISWKALQLLKSLNLIPKRTIRSILWTAEESCYCGAVQYSHMFNDTENEEFNYFIESDRGTYTPTGLDFSGNAEAECIMREIMNLMTPLNATKFQRGVSNGPDIEAWHLRGFPASSLLTKNDEYFWFHHTAGDSMLWENSDDLDKNCALFAAAAYVIADLSIDMPKNTTPIV